MKKFLISTVAVALIFLSCTAAQARNQIRIVGSSTVYPFATVVAEKFGIGTKFKTPVVESTGSGGGLKIFCQGIGPSHVDITNASRRIKEKEVKKCATNGITEITEVKGNNAHPIFKWAELNYGKSAIPKWNFYKILINKEGKIEDTYSSFTSPTSNKIVSKIKELLKI